MAHHHSQHHHGHQHSHAQASANYSRAFAIGTILNVGFVAVEAGYGYLAHSLALVADAGHNLSDVLGLLLAWGASALSRRPPTKRYTYGLRGSSILAALFNAIFLLLAMGAIAWEAIRRAQQLIAQHIPASVSLVDELIADRRAEAAREDMEFQTVVLQKLFKDRAILTINSRSHSDSEKLRHEFCLSENVIFFDFLNLPFTDHIHRFITSQASPRRVE